MNIMKWLVVATFLAATAACNTMEGLGEDVQAGGKNLEDAAEKSKRK
mgnify:CR=1 FL=1